MSPFIAEFVGTALLILFGNGVVANVCLNKTKGNNAGWLVINAGWGVAVFIGAACSEQYSGAHLNPAVSWAMVAAGNLSFFKAIEYTIAQMLGAMLGGCLVYLFYQRHFEATNDGDVKLGCFCNAPAIRDFPKAFFCEVVGTFALLLPIFLMAKPSLKDVVAESASEPVLGLGAVGLLPVGLLVFGIGMSLGGTTGYAINPARDLGPRIVHYLLPISNKRDSDWQYAWIPVVGPIAGGILAAVVYRILI